MSQSERTYAELDRLLSILNFQIGESADQSRTYWHEFSDTIILLSAAKPTTAVTEADLASVRVRLAGRGLLNPSAFDDFVNRGILPAA